MDKIALEDIRSSYPLHLLKIILSAINQLILVAKSINWLAAVALFIMMSIAFADVFLRYFFNNPIYGAKDITELLMVIMVFFSVAYTQIQKGHVGVDFVVNKLAVQWRIIINAFVHLLSVVIFLLIAWRNFEEALLFLARNQVTMELEIPVYPFLFSISIGCLMLSIVLLRDFLECLKEGIEHNLKYYHWLSLIFIAILILGGSIFWMLQGSLRPDPRIVGFLSVIFFLVLLSTGIPIGFILTTVAFLGITNIRGLEASYSILGTVLFRNTGSYAWSVFPLFVLMGYFCYYLDISKDLFDSAYKFFGRLPGGLAIATVGSCTAFGAISGDNAAGAATMGVVALPELKKYRYNTRLALGCIVGGGTLEFLIPPSIGMILYGVLAEQSIADLFIAGIVPGLICATFFSIYIYIACKRNPELGPKGPKFPIKEKIKSLKSTWPILFLFLIVIGGLYGGMFTPTEAGGVGAFMAMTIGLFMQRLTIRKLINALVETGRISAMVFIILGGAVLFGYFLTASQFTLELANFVAGLNMPPIFVVIAILLVFLILGFFMPGSAILLINIPIFLPLVKSLGFDLIWFGVLCVMMQNIGALTPPFGFVVYAVKGVAIDVPISEIFWGAVPFLMILVVMVVLTIMFPEIATWLPYSLKR